MFKEYSEYDAVGLANLIHNREISASEVLEACIHQIEKANPRINAVVNKMYEMAHLQISELEAQVKKFSNSSQVAQAFPFLGVPFLVKDLGAEIKGAATSKGTRLRRNLISKADSFIVERWRQAGLIFPGKTNVPELGIMGVTEPELWGPCRNPWDLGRTSGGSSGGSAAAVAARMVPMASGDDGGGSIRIPAAACGIFGLKPSRGLQPMGPGDVEGWLGLVSGHVLSRTVRDSALALQLTQGGVPGAPYGPVASVAKYLDSSGIELRGKKIAYWERSLMGRNIDAENLKALEETLQTCVEMGLEIKSDLPSFNKEELLFYYYVIVASSVAGELERLESQLGSTIKFGDVEATTWFLKVAGQKLRAVHLEQALYEVRRSTFIWDQFLKEYSYFCTPTLGDLPNPIGLMSLGVGERLASFLSPYIPRSIILKVIASIGARGIEKTPNTALFNMSGHPAMSVPTYWTHQKIPIGIQFVGRMGREDELFALAAALEQKYQWGNRRPEGF